MRITISTTQAFLVLCILASGWAAWAQAPPEKVEHPKYSPEIGLHSGPLIMSQVGGVDDILPSWGARLGLLTKMGTIETDTLFAHAYGVTYYVAGLDYRLDIINDYIPVHFLIGGRFDYFKPNNEPKFKIAGGWHYGGGVIEQIGGPWAVRGDFKFRFSPGTSIYISLGLMYRFPAGGEQK